MKIGQRWPENEMQECKVIFSRALRVVVCAVAFIFICSCKGLAVDKEFPQNVEVLYSSLQCGRNVEGPAVSWISDMQQLNLVYKRLTRHILGLDIKIPTVDFDKDAVILIEMGQRPTTGYALVLGEGPLLISDGVVNMKTIWVKPAQDAAQAQLVTSPCIIVKFISGDYTRIRVLDQENKMVAETTVGIGDTP